MAKKKEETTEEVVENQEVTEEVVKKSVTLTKMGFLLPYLTRS